MAIVIKTDTRDYSPVYNKMEVAILQTDASIRGKIDYKYIFDIYINDPITGLTEIIRTKVTPDPVQKFGIQDVSGIISAFVEERLTAYDSTLAFDLTENGIIRYYIKYGEEYRLTASDPILFYINLLTGADKYAWGASLEKHRWIDFYNNTEFEDYIFNVNLVGEFLTNYKTPSVQITDLGWHWYLTDSPSEVDYLEIKTYDSTGTIISTFKVSNTTNPTTMQSLLVRVATAPQSLNNISGGLFLSGAQPVIISTVASYTIQCFRTDTSPVGEMLTFTIEEPCFYETFRIHFENEYGAYDSFNFGLNSKRMSEGERKTYISNKPVLNSSGLVYQHVTDEKINYYTKFTNKITLKSDFITEAQNEWLKELSFSPRTYLEYVDGNGVHNFKPCIVSNTRWNEQITEIDKLFTFELEIELEDNFRQRR